MESREAETFAMMNAKCFACMCFNDWNISRFFCGGRFVLMSRRLPPYLIFGQRLLLPPIRRDEVQNFIGCLNIFSSSEDDFFFR